MTRIKRTNAAESCPQPSRNTVRPKFWGRWPQLGRPRLAAHLLAGAALGALYPVQSHASNLLSLPMTVFDHNPGMLGTGMFVGLVLITTLTAVLYISSRNRWAEREAKLTRTASELRVKLDRAHVFLSSEPQIVVVWGSTSGEPDIEGDISLVSELPIPRRVLGFGSWLPPDQAQDMDNAVDRLRSRGEGFRMALQTVQGRHLEAEGRAIAGRAILRICDVSGDRLELTRLR